MKMMRRSKREMNEIHMDLEETKAIGCFLISYSSKEGN